MELGGLCNYSLVHFILKSAAKSVFNALDAKELDNILIDWLWKRILVSSPFTIQALGFRIRYLKRAGKMARISAFGHQTRSALFYAPVELVARVASAGAKSVLSDISFNDANLKFLNTITFYGTTALVVAAANGD